MALLYGMERTNHNSDDPKFLGKNIFTNAFPLSLANYIDRERKLPIPVVSAAVTDDGAITTQHTDTAWKDIIGSDPKTAEWNFETQAQRKDPNDPKLDDLIILNREGSNKLIDLIRSLDSIPVTGEKTSRVDDDVLTRIIDDQNELQRLYEQDPEAIQTLVETETSAAEIKELKNRRDVVDTMQSWLDDDEAFAEAKAAAGGAEKAWQNLLEANPWVLGVGLGGRLYTTWDEGKLEQTVRGANLHTSGKRADAFLVSNGLLRSVALAEIKHPDTPLLTQVHYRSDAYAISYEFSGAIAQAQETVRAAKESLAGWISERDDEGGNTGDGAYLVEPRSFLVIGSMSDLCSAKGNRIDAKFRSFESFRSNLRSPEVLTFDELVERARWNVELAERQDETETEFSDTEF